MNIQVQRAETPAERKLAAAFAETKAALPGGAGRLAAREKAFARFAEAGLPHRRVEEFKYTDLKARLREVPDAGQTRVETFGAGGGVIVRPLAEALGEEAVQAMLSQRFTGFDSPILDLNEAFADAGVAVDVTAGSAVEAPLRARFVAPQGKRGDSQGVYRVAGGAKVTVIEKLSAAGENSHSGHVAHLEVGEGADVTFIRHVDAGAGGVHLGGLAVTIAAKAKVDVLLLVSSGALVRTDIGMRFTGADALANVRGLHLAGSERHVDTTMFVDHAEPGCVSRELFKSVLDDAARSVFQGKILVRPIAQKTDGKMMAQALMLSDDAEADSKPELEIYADDVQCGHGATTGRVDDTLLFYLMARGIPRREAVRMLVSAFAAEVFDDLDEAIAEEFSAVAEEWLERHLGG